MTSQYLKISDAYDISSNSPEIGIEEKRVCKVIPATDTHKVVVLKPIIDKLRLTFSGLGAISHVTDLQAAPYWEEINKAALMVADSDDCPQITRCKIEGYWTGLRVELGGGAVATFGMKPRNIKNAAVRLELNPAKMSAECVAELMDAWNLMEGGNIPLAAHLTSARVSRCDVAVDILNLQIADLYVHCPEVWKIWACTSMEGGVQTLNFYKAKKGQPAFVDPKSRSNVTVYDKRAERQAGGG